MTEEIFERLENKIDKLTEAVTRLVLVEERQTRHGERLGELETRSTVLECATRAIDKKMDKWINLGMGGWGVIVILFAVFGHFYK